MTRTAVSIGLALMLSGCGNSDAPATATAPAPGAPAKAPGAAPAPGAPPPAKAPATTPAPAPPPAKGPAAGPPPTPVSPRRPPPRAASTPTPPPKELDSSERPLPPTSYDARGRRDPFQHVEVPKPPRPPAVAATRLTGIVRNESGALALVEGADGIGYVLRPGDTLLDGRLVEIGADRVVFTVLGRPGPPERVTLRLSSSD